MPRITAARPDDPVFPLPDSRYEGLTVRQLYVAAVLAGLASRPKGYARNEPTNEAIVERACVLADLALKRQGMVD